MEADKKLQSAVVKLILDDNANVAFFASLAMNTRFVPSNDIETAGVTADNNSIVCYYNPDFINRLSLGQTAFLVAHEVMHIALMHAARKGGREHRRWNYWCDAVINDIIRKAKIVDLIPDGVMIPDASTRSEEELYAADNRKQLGPYGIGEDILPIGKGTPAEIAEAVENCRALVNQAANMAKMRGTVSANLSRVIEKATEVVIPWYERLRDYMCSVTKTDYSWRRPSRRFIANGLYLPSYGQTPSMGPLVIAIDTSGSISATELENFFGHLNKIIEDTLPEAVHVIYCDAEATYGGEYHMDDLPIVPDKIKGGGGTSFIPVFNLIDKMGIDPDLVIYFTDGYGDQEVCVAPNYPVIWATTNKVSGFNFGTVILIKEESYSLNIN